MDDVITPVSGIKVGKHKASVNHQVVVLTTSRLADEEKRNAGRKLTWE